MNNWQRVRTIFDDALRQPPADRSRFVVSACGGDDELRREVEDLLKSLESARQFLETPAVVQVVESSLEPDQRLSYGEMLLHYEVRELLGSGGMGEVYLARDTRLNRNVALKVLRVNFLSDPQASRRLLREARAAALLEHPNICHIYEISETDEHCFIVMQYVVGTTLADLIAHGGIGVATTLNYATQLAEGLAEAHRNGIIHRDIKPQNVIVDGKGQVKILDFGLAKFIEAEASIDTTHRLNSTGAVMGTIPYMSPEQLRGKPVDARTDIFSVGALLYEMLAGKRAFNRDNNAETIASILNDEPDWSAVPRALVPILQKCLAKDVAQRYSTADELLPDLREKERTGIGEEETSEVEDPITVETLHTTGGTQKQKRNFYFWQSGGEAVESETEGESERPLPAISLPAGSLMILALIAVGVLGIGIWRWSRNNIPNFDSLRASQLNSWKSGLSVQPTDFRVSHDGKTIAYSSSQSSDTEGIYIKQTRGGEEFRVTKDDWTNVSPLWSPDDENIAYVSVREDKPGIYMIPRMGGPTTFLANTENANIALRHWSRKDDAIFYELSGNLYRLDIATHKITRATQLPDSAHSRDFSFSPDETQVVYCDSRDGQRDLWTMPIAGGEPTRLTNDVDSEQYPLWHPDGEWILYNVDRDGLRQISLASINGSVTPAQVTRGDSSFELIDISPEGDKIYYWSRQTRSDITSVDVDSGMQSEVANEPDLEFWGDVSPDGASFVYQVAKGERPGKLYRTPLTIRSSDGQRRDLTTEGFDARWLADSRRLAVFRLDETTRAYGVWLVDTISGAEHQITNEDVMTSSFTPMPITRGDIGAIAFSPDSSRIVYISARSPQNAKVSYLDGPTVNLTNNDKRNISYESPRFSPNGSRVALVAVEQRTETNQRPIQRLQVFDGSDGRDVFSTTDLARFIGWSNDSELIMTSVGERIPAVPVPVDVVSVSTNGSSRKLFTLIDTHFRSLTLSPDGKTLAFVRMTNGRDDIWTVPLTAGAEPKQITFNGVSRQFLVNLVFSPNGKTIYFDKQEEINTISMFENFN